VVRKNFCLLADAEITVEINPGDRLESFLAAAKRCGVNRLSIGVQSANDDELKVLGRRHSFKDAAEAVTLARRQGFENISADIMLGLPNSSADSLKISLEGILSLGTEHLSAYILKLEEDSPLYKTGTILPDDDEVADQYLLMCEVFELSGLSLVIINLLKPICKFLGLPVELTKLILLKPFSGSGSLALLAEIFKTYGVNSYLSLSAAAVYGSSETIFYVTAVYLSKCQNKKVTKAILISLFATFFSTVLSCNILKLFY
jgi:spore maturation protein SpmB